jgi:hypothetical protein
MPILVIASVCLQAFCLFHMVRSGRPYWWAWIIVLGAFLGAFVYFVTQVLPDLRHDPAARRAVRHVQRAIDPERERKRIAAQLEVADTVDNRLKLAAECLVLGDLLNAEELYLSCLKGVHATDPDILLGVAKAQFGRGDAAAAKKTLDTLIASNPGFNSYDGHLLYARSLEALGDDTGALHEYETLAASFPGEEGRARYGLLLKRMNRPTDAQQVFKQILARIKVAPKYYQRAQREWIELAREQLRP